MAQRASVFEGVQIGLETTPGTSVPANKLLQSISIQPAIKAEFNRFRALGKKFASLVTPGKEWVEAKVTGAPTYDELTYLLASLISYASPTGADIEKTWLFSPSTSAPDTVKTYTIEQGSSVRAHKFAYGLMTGLTLSYSRKEIGVDGAMIGQRLSDGIILTASPTAIPLVPVLPSQVSVFLADSAAGLDSATALTNAISASWGLTDRFSTFWALNATKTSFSDVVEAEPKLTAKLKMPADVTSMGLLATMRTGESIFLRVQATGEIIDAEPYSLTVDLALKVNEVSEFSDEDGVFAIEWGFEGVHDTTWGKALEVTLVNTLASL